VWFVRNQADISRILLTLKLRHAPVRVVRGFFDSAFRPSKHKGPVFHSFSSFVALFLFILRFDFLGTVLAS
jgi:hypothetical protein